VTYYADDAVTLYHGDCIEVMRGMADASVDAIVTDPPYGLEFMGKEWDAPWKLSGDVVDDPASLGGYQDPGGGNGYTRSRIRFGMGDMPGFQSWCTEWATEALRVLKPGGHLLAFGGTRTWHRLACAIEDAGFEIRDSIAWMYGSGFPKSLDVSKAIDKQRDDRGDVLRVTGEIARLRDAAGLTNRDIDDAFGFAGMAGHWTSVKSQPAVPTVEQWRTLRDLLSPDEWLDAEVWRLNGRKGTPGVERPDREVSGPAGNDVFQPTQTVVNPGTPVRDDAARWQGWGTALKPAFEPIVVARKPLIGTVAANVLAHGTGALNIDGCRIGGDPDRASGWSKTGSKGGPNDAMSGDNYDRDPKPDNPAGRWPANVILDESQSAELDAQSGVSSSVQSVRLRAGAVIGNGQTHGTFIASRDNIGGFNDSGGASRFFYTAKANTHERPSIDGAAHPTVKPLDLMRHLVRLVTPPGGTVLEPFAGSGTTAEACIVEGFKCIAIEREADYLPLIVQRVSKPIQVTLL
jgi:DNA modification methylase